MNYNTLTRTLCLAALCAGALAGGYVALGHLDRALDAWAGAAPNVGPTLAKVNATLDVINAPCVGFHGSVTCGALAQLSQTEKNVGIVAGQSALQVKQSGVLIDAAATSVKAVSEHVNMAADAATGTLAQAQVDLTSLNTTIKGVAPVLLRADDAIGDVDAFIKDNSPIVHQLAVNVDGMTDSANKMLVTGNQVEQKLANCTLHPTFPCVFKADAMFAAQMFGYAVR